MSVKSVYLVSAAGKWTMTELAMAAAADTAECVEEVEVRGHIIDSLILPKILDGICAGGGSFRIVDTSTSGVELGLEKWREFSLWHGMNVDRPVRNRAEEELRESQQRLERLLEAVSAYTYSVEFQDGVPVSTRHGAACGYVTGYSPQEYSADRFLWFNMIHPEDRARVQRHVASLLREDTVPPIEHRILHKDGSVRWVRDTIVRQFDGTGILTGYDGLVEDITERRNIDHALQRNLQAQSSLTSLLRLCLEPLPLEELLGRTLELLFEAPWVDLESTGAVFLVETAPEMLVMKAHRGLPDALVAACKQVPFRQCLCGQAASDGQIMFADCVDRRHERCRPNLLPHGHFCLPIVSDGDLLGVISLYVKHGRQNEPEEEQFLSGVANLLAEIVKRKKSEEKLAKREAQLLAAQKIQQRLLPASPPPVPGFDLAGACFPAEFAGGDCFDFLWLPDGSLAVVIGDVSGHAVDSALLMASTSAHLRSFAEDHDKIEEILAHTNSLLCRETEEGRFVTLLFARVDVGSRTLHFVNAGHPSGYVLGPSAETKAILGSNTRPLAVLPDTPFPVDGPLSFEPNDIVLLITDGILEARSPRDELFGAERMLEVVRANHRRKAADIIRSLEEAIRDFDGRRELHDDVTIVVIKVEPGAAARGV
jgi:sigma-B regulation protein RsbU (phosphoserine phosphatase)